MKKNTVVKAYNKDEGGVYHTVKFLEVVKGGYLCQFGNGQKQVFNSISEHKVTVNSVLRKIKLVHVNDIKEGDCIIYLGRAKTVCKNNIKYNKFMGRSILGYNYRGGTEYVQLVDFSF